MQKEIDQLRHKFRKGRSELFRQVSWTAPSRALLEAHAALVDEILKEIYKFSCRSADRMASRSVHSGLAIVATGGFGRRELNPYSDIDIAFIPSEEEDPWVEALVHTAFKLVMDVFLSLRDIHVGYAFRPVAEATAWDVATKTALLDLRHICGDPELADGLRHRIREVLSPLDLMLEMSSSKVRRGKNSSSLYAVEPNLKEGPGSLRDLHRARWIFKLLFGIEDKALESALRDSAGMSQRQISQVREAADWFLRARTWLHLAAGRLSDVLIINYQDRIARELNGCSAQDWLERHLMHSETLARFREWAVRALLQGPLKTNGVFLENGSLHLSEDVQASAARMFQISQRYAIPISLKDLQRLEEEREQSLQVRVPSDEEVWAFNQMLGEGRDLAATLRALSDFGILDRFIPDFSKVMRFVPPDPAHSYTIGEHSIRMIEHLESLRAGLDPEGRRFADLLTHCPHFDMLCLGALLHDAGKLIPGRDHCETSAELAKTVSARLNLAPEKSEMLDVLVRQHLLLVRTARLHDLKSINVIQKVAELVPTLEALRHLYVFTYVDTFAVAEKNWTSMDDRDLEDLYRRMQDIYAPSTAESAGVGVQEDQGVLIRKKLAALQTSKNQSAVLKHCDSMPAGYVLNTPLGEIASHLQLLDRLEAESVVLDVYNRPGDDYSELTICAYDDPLPGMLAKITGVLYGCDADIHKAQAFTMEKEKPVILDTLWIRANGMQISENKARRIRAALKEVLTGAKPIDQFLKQAGKNPPNGILLDSIDLSNELSEEHTVVHIVARDLQGLLYLMTRCLSRCELHIHSAKIATWNARAENNFYVTMGTGGRIPDAELLSWTDRLSRVLRGAGIAHSSP
jgi:[protein-PII] uridylyltransferase